MSSTTQRSSSVWPNALIISDGLEIGDRVAVQGVKGTEVVVGKTCSIVVCSAPTTTSVPVCLFHGAETCVLQNRLATVPFRQPCKIFGGGPAMAGAGWPAGHQQVAGGPEAVLPSVCR